MSKRKVLIADPETAFADALAQALEPELQVLRCTRGEEAAALLKEQEPDLLVLELMLQGLDGLGVLRTLASSDIRPRILVASAMLTDFVLFTLTELGVQYALRKPCSPELTAERALQLLRPEDFSADAPIPALLRQLGIPEARQGYPYLVMALDQLSRHRDQRMAKELYTRISETYGTAVTAVEKAIRDAIADGWRLGNPEIWRQHFPRAVKPPTNREFLFRLANVLTQYLRCG